MQGLSLDQAPPYFIPILYYITGTAYLLLFCIALLFYGLHVENRYYLEAIAITHVLTLGFFTHIIFGTLFQMMPVIIGVAYQDVERKAEYLLLFLNNGILSFLGYFFFHLNIFIFLSILLLSGSFIFFALYSLVTILKTEDKNIVVKSFIAVFVFMIIGAQFGAFALLQHIGLMGTLKFGDIHFTVMLFGVIFMLFCAVTYKIIPMFYVTKEYPSTLKKTLLPLLSFTVLLLILSTLFEYETIQKILKIVLSAVVMSFSFFTIKLLKNRKRARSDITVNLFYFASVNLALGALLWIVCILFDKEADFAFGVFFGLGFAYGLINGMLYKIVPFLTWFHLSSKFIYDAEMGEVMKPHLMRSQFYLFMTSYALFIFALFFKPLLPVAAIVFFISSSLLMYNLVQGYHYHEKRIAANEQR